MVQVLELHELGREVGLDLHPRLVATVRTHSPPDHIGFIVLGLEEMIHISWCLVKGQIQKSFAKSAMSGKFKPHQLSSHTR